MPSQRLIERAMRLPPKYRVIKDNQRTLLCTHGKGKKAKPCLTRFRVKEFYPGVYDRVCPTCGETSYFELFKSGGVDPATNLPLLRFKWLTKQEADSIESAFLANTVDVGLWRGISASEE